MTAARGNNAPATKRPSTSPIGFLRAAKAAGMRELRRLRAPPVRGRPEVPPVSAPRNPRAITFANIGKLIDEVTILYGEKPIWITEYGYETSPPDHIFGVSWDRQATYMHEAYTIARRNPRIDMLLWFLVRDEGRATGWQSGLVSAGLPAQAIVLQVPAARGGRAAPPPLGPEEEPDVRAELVHPEHPRGLAVSGLDAGLDRARSRIWEALSRPLSALGVAGRWRAGGPRVLWAAGGRRRQLGTPAAVQHASCTAPRPRPATRPATRLLRAAARSSGISGLIRWASASFLSTSIAPGATDTTRIAGASSSAKDRVGIPSAAFAGA